MEDAVRSARSAGHETFRRSGVDGSNPLARVGSRRGPPAGGSAQCPTRGCRLAATHPKRNVTEDQQHEPGGSDPRGVGPRERRPATVARGASGGEHGQARRRPCCDGGPGEVRPRSGRRIGKRRGRPRNRCARGESSGAARGKGADQSNHADAILNDAYPTHDTVTCVRHHEGIGHRVAGSRGRRRCVDRQREAGVDHLDLRRRRLADHRSVRRPRRDVRRQPAEALSADRSRAGHGPAVSRLEAPRVRAVGDVAAGPSEGEIVQRDLAVIRDGEDRANMVADPSGPRTVTAHGDRRLTPDGIHMRRGVVRLGWCRFVPRRNGDAVAHRSARTVGVDPDVDRRRRTGASIERRSDANDRERPSPFGRADRRAAPAVHLRKEVDGLHTGGQAVRDDHVMRDSRACVRDRQRIPERVTLLDGSGCIGGGVDDQVGREDRVGCGGGTSDRS